MHHPRHHHQGFSLVELSIVLVILGLLTGGILTGQNLIRAAELRSVTTEFQNYQTAVMTFRGKYFAMPGDMTNAQSFWGTAANCPGTQTQGSTDATTCNGDGDGNLEENPGAGLGNEFFRFWQHLANSGLIEGSYSGVRASTGNDDASVGVNVPTSKLGLSGWSIETVGTQAITSTDYFEGTYDEILFFGSNVGVGTDATRTPTLVPEEAWNIDTKVDDGRPATGALRTMEREGAECNTVAAAATALVATAEYNLTETDTECNLLFNLR